MSQTEQQYERAMRMRDEYELERALGTRMISLGARGLRKEMGFLRDLKGKGTQGDKTMFEYRLRRVIRRLKEHL